MHRRYIHENNEHLLRVGVHILAFLVFGLFWHNMPIVLGLQISIQNSERSEIQTSSQVGGFTTR